LISSVQPTETKASANQPMYFTMLPAVEILIFQWHTHMLVVVVVIHKRAENWKCSLFFHHYFLSLLWLWTFLVMVLPMKHKEYQDS